VWGETHQAVLFPYQARHRNSDSHSSVTGIQFRTHSFDHGGADRDGLRRRSAVRGWIPDALEHLATEPHDSDGDRIDLGVDSQTNGPGIGPHHGTRPPDLTRRVRFHLDDKLSVDQLGDQSRDGRPVESGPLGQLGSGQAARTVGQTQDHRKIVTSHVIAVAAAAGLPHLAHRHIDDFSLSRDQCFRPMTLAR